MWRSQARAQSLPDGVQVEDIEMAADTRPSDDPNPPRRTGLEAKTAADPTLWRELKAQGPLSLRRDAIFRDADARWAQRHGPRRTRAEIVEFRR